jgi:signal transduction histidine kinase
MAEELEHTEVLRGDFVNNFSHEFKTPIVSIAGFTKLLKKGNLTEEQRAEYLDIIEEESLRLSEMATNVLNMTKIENQTILTDVTTYNLSEQMRSCVLLLEKRWTNKKLELSLEFDEYNICACEELLKQVWINLIDNSVKYSPEYGVIVIRIREEGENYHISIANSGIEIPEEKRQKIFEKFYQADESHSSAGNGIGLSIVKSVIDLHGGKVWVECKNGITTFHVIIASFVSV